ncbi:hypothetical protein, partial [Frankia sp. Cr1]|uniref:hypothetical protein n=1 Tax=Frankia sp. Cr1 TaxID=3073931 RepID=UPI003A100C74
PRAVPSEVPPPVGPMLPAAEPGTAAAAAAGRDAAPASGGTKTGDSAEGDADPDGDAPGDDSANDDRADPDSDEGSDDTDADRPRRSAELSNAIENASLVMNGGIAIFGARTGDVIGGSGGLGGPGEPHGGTRRGDAESGRVPDSVLDRLTASFVPPACYPRLLRAVGQRRVVVFRAVPGWGRGTTALRVLAELCDSHYRGDGGCGGVRRLEPDPAVPLRRLTFRGARPLPRQAAYLVENAPFDDLAALRASDLDRIGRELAEIDSYLVVTVDAEVSFRGDLDGYLVDGEQPPSALALLASHVAWSEGVKPDEVKARIAATPEISVMLDGLVANGPDATAVAELASRLARWEDEPERLQRATAWAGNHSTSRIHAWLSGLDTQQMAFVLALAVLDGRPYRTVAQAAALLVTHLRAAGLAPAANAHPAGSTAGTTAGTGVTGTATRAPGPAPEAEAVPGLPAGPLGVGLADLLKVSLAEVTEGLEPTGFGLVRTKVLRFRDSTYPRRVLEWAWQDHAEAQLPLLAWLAELATDRRSVVRVRAAAATGLISRFAFDDVRRQLWLPWSTSPNQRYREAVLAALRVPAETVELAPHVHRMLTDWRRHTSNPWRLWTTARAWGASVGRTNPYRALQVLGDLADTASLVVSRAISQSVYELFDGAPASLRKLVVGDLVDWASDERQAVRRTAAHAFLQLALDATAAGLPDAELWPALLAMIEADELDAATLEPLWVAVAEFPELARTAARCLRDWVLAAEEDRRLEEPLGRAVRGRVGTDDELRHLYQLLDDWQADAPLTTRYLVALLDSISEPTR